MLLTDVNFVIAGIWHYNGVMNRNLGTALILLAALLGQTATAALSLPCAATMPASAHMADAAPDTAHHHEHATASNATGESGCCPAAADTGCDMSGCLLSAVPVSASPVGVTPPQPARLVPHPAAPPPPPVFPLFRPPIA